MMSDSSSTSGEDTANRKIIVRKRTYDEVFDDGTSIMTVMKPEIPQDVLDIREPLLNRFKPFNITPVETYGVDWEEKSTQRGLMEHSIKLLAIMKEKLLQRKWGDVAQIVNGLALSCSSKDFIPSVVWRVGNEVLYNHPLSNLVMISDHMDASTAYHKHVDPIEILMEYSYFLFLIKDFSKALEVAKSFENPLSSSRVDTRYKNLRKRISNWRPLSEAYIGLGLYLQWGEVVMHEGGFDCDLESQSDTSQLANSAISYFDKAFNTAGVWDNFVIKEIELLKKYKKIRKAKDVLEKYGNKNPQNPNALVYLFKFLQEFSHENNEEAIEILLKLKELNPTHDLMLNLCNELKDKIKKVSIIFDLVEYEKWKDNSELWKELCEVFNSTDVTDNSEIHNEILNVCYKGDGNLTDRSLWWPEYFFSGDEYARIADLDQNLLESKYYVACALKLKKCTFCKLFRRNSGSY